MLAAGAAGLGLHVRRNLGASRAELARLAESSPHARDGFFANTEAGLPPAKASLRMIVNMLRSRNSQGAPRGPIPVAPLQVPAAPGDLAFTWLGHAGVLLEVDGRRVLVDPVWSEFASPVPFAGPRRLHPPVAPLAALPEADVVLLSHDHYDHLDRQLATLMDEHGPFSACEGGRHGTERFVTKLGQVDPPPEYFFVLDEELDHL